MKFDYYKYHGLGNDYIVIDPQQNPIQLNAESIKKICDRNFGIGSDGILFGPLLDGNRIRLRIFNPDGSEAEKSGNGIRIFSRYLSDAGYLKSNPFYLDTLGGRVLVKLLGDSTNLIQVDMGKVTFFSPDIPVAGNPREVVDEPLPLENETYRITCLSIGNPHCVIPLKNISRELAKKIGPVIEKHSLFPHRINIQFMKVLDDRNIQIEIWERGAGYTLASGSSSCAAASAAYRLGLVANDIQVHMPGGIIKVEIGSDGHVHMTGPVEGVCRGVFHPDLLKHL